MSERAACVLHQQASVQANVAAEEGQVIAGATPLPLRPSPPPPPYHPPTIFMLALINMLFNDVWPEEIF